MDVDLALIGVVLDGVQNHSLGALLGAARRAGASARVVPFSGWGGMERTLATLLALRPRVCGVSLQTSEAALATMALVKLLRARGFSGRIVCGGHFATLQAQELLRINPALDAVVRFAGEEALCGMLRQPLDDDALAQLPGTVFRAADGAIRIGAPARIRVPGPLDAVLERGGDAPLHLGFGAVDLIVSQGCEASCAYCCVAGATKLASREQRRAELSGAPHSRMGVSSIADWIATLYHERRARVFNFMDDNLLPLEPGEAADWASQLRQALRARAVGPIAFSLQLRADALSPHSADALVELGLARAYVGIDGYSAPQLRALGRRAEAAAGARALALLWERGVFAVANALLIGPTIRFESVLAEIEGLARIQHAPVHLLPIEARPGTRHFARAERLGLLEGGLLLQHYRFVDHRTELVGRVVTALPTRLAERSVPIGLYDLGYNLGIVRRLLPGAALGGFAERYARVAAAWNRDQVRLLREAAAAAGQGAQQVDALIARERPRVTAHDRALLADCDAALAELEALVSALQRRPVRAHARGKLLGALALSMSLAGCSEGLPDRAAGGDAAVVSGGLDAAAGAFDGAAGADSSTTGHGADAAAHDAAPRDARASDARASDAGGGAGSGPGDGAAGGCAPGAALPDSQQVASCHYVLCASVSIQFDAQGKPSAITAADGGVLPEDVRACLASLLGDYCYPSLAGMTQELSSHCWLA